MASKKIVIIDDDQDLREALAEQLELHEGFEIYHITTAAEGLCYLKSETADLVLLDIGLPDMDGRELCKLIRKAGILVPVIMLTGMESDADTILGLDAGANDYVIKPFKFGVLLARIRAQLRLHEQSEDAIFSVGPYQFKPSGKLMEERETGRKVRLTEKETAILKYLYRSGANSVGRDELLAEVWGYNSSVTTHTLETHIYRLRQKIETGEGKAKILVTDSDGYRLSGIPQ